MSMMEKDLIKNGQLPKRFSLESKSADSIIRLNIGGHSFITTKTTLVGRGENFFSLDYLVEEYLPKRMKLERFL